MQIDQKQKRVAVYIDGSNFFYKLRDIDISNITYFDYGGLADWLARDREIISKIIEENRIFINKNFY